MGTGFQFPIVSLRAAELRYGTWRAHHSLWGVVAVGTGGGLGAGGPAPARPGGGAGISAPSGPNVSRRDAQAPVLMHAWQSSGWIRPSAIYWRTDSSVYGPYCSPPEVRTRRPTSALHLGHCSMLSATVALQFGHCMETAPSCGRLAQASAREDVDTKGIAKPVAV